VHRCCLGLGRKGQWVKEMVQQWFHEGKTHYGGEENKWGVKEKHVGTGAGRGKVCFRKQKKKVH